MTEPYCRCVCVVCERKGSDAGFSSCKMQLRRREGEGWGRVGGGLGEEEGEDGGRRKKGRKKKGRDGEDKVRLWRRVGGAQ